MIQKFLYSIIILLYLLMIKNQLSQPFQFFMAQRVCVLLVLNCCLNEQWRREVAFAGFDVAIQMDISAEKMLFGVSGVNPERRAELIKVC